MPHTVGRRDWLMPDSRSHASDDPKVHQDGVMAAQERLPAPECIPLTGCVMISVGDDDLPAIVGGWVSKPMGWRTAWSHRMATAGEDLIVVTGRDPLGPAPQQRFVDFGLVCDRELHGHPDRVSVIAHLPLIPLDDIDHPVLPLGGVAPLGHFAKPQHFGKALVDGSAA